MRFLKIILSNFPLFYRLKAKYLIVNIFDFLRGKMTEGGQVSFCPEFWKEIGNFCPEFWI